MIRTKEVTFLGVVLDENLSWKSHISHIARKISKSVGIIGRSSSCLTKLALKTLHCSLVEGGVRVHGDVVLRCFWCGFSENCYFNLRYNIAVFH